MSALEQTLRSRFGAGLITNRPLADVTSFRIGGPADLFVVAENESELGFAIAAAHRDGVPVFCLGSGTNLLVSDQGIRGLVVKLGAGFAHIRIDGLEVQAGAAALFGDLARLTAEQGLAGLEFGEGIPGSVGGGLVMNAGAFGGEIAKVVTAVRGIDHGGAPLSLTPQEVGFAYRRTALPRGFTITSVAFYLAAGDRVALRGRVDEIHDRRMSRQPCGVPNAGSIFKNPPGGFAGRLLEEAGLKGARAGGAAFSEQHANFIVNLGGALAREVCELMELARERVRARTGVTLEAEVRLIGDW
jgi:UDP-N-acetylmuramate dehydrogenase